jgi:hypothetical protein
MSPWVNHVVLLYTLSALQQYGRKITLVHADFNHALYASSAKEFDPEIDSRWRRRNTVTQEFLGGLLESLGHSRPSCRKKDYL